MNRLIKINVGLCLIILLSFSALGCVERFSGEDARLSTGEVLTPEMIESIFAEISAAVTEKYPMETMDDGSVLVYWLSGGSVWHASLNCGSMSGASSENLSSGSISEAVASGKERGCRICAKELEPTEQTVLESTEDLTDSDETVGEKYPKEYLNGELVVHWLKGGSVWHVSRNCSSLAKSSDADIVSGTEAEAINSGKERACRICSKSN